MNGKAEMKANLKARDEAIELAWNSYKSKYLS